MCNSLRELPAAIKTISLKLFLEKEVFLPSPIFQNIGPVFGILIPARAPFSKWRKYTCARHILVGPVYPSLQKAIASQAQQQRAFL